MSHERAPAAVRDPSNPPSVHTWMTEVYEELRRLASAKMAAMKPGQTLQPTALVHEVWLRLAGQRGGSWQNRAHFFATAADAMRHILVDQTRRKHAAKRGGGASREELDDSILAAPAPDEELLAVHDAVDALAHHDGPASEVVKLRYFIGFTLEETAEALGVSPRSVGHLWEYGRAWLLREIQKQRQR